MIIFWDIDDTIYSRCEVFCRACGAYFHPPLPDEEKAYRCCTKRGDEVFKASQTGEISMDEMYIYRYCKGFADAGRRIGDREALDFQKAYRKAQDEISCSETMRQALRLSHLYADGTGILTNGPSEKQRRKLSSLKIGEYLTDGLVIISGETGLDKPEKEIFRLAEEKSGERAENIWLIGDSPEHDILPARKEGWKTIWFNRRGLLHEECRRAADITVNTEQELLEAVRGLFK